jgi:hypothetical protein
MTRSFGRRITDHVRVASVVAEQFNEKNGGAMLSADAIGFESGSKWPRRCTKYRPALNTLLHNPYLRFGRMDVAFLCNACLALQ